MPTVTDLLMAANVEREQIVQSRERGLSKIKFIITKANSEGRSVLTEDERSDVDNAEASVQRAKRDLVGVDDKLRRLQEVDKEERDAAAAAELRHEDPTTSPSRRAKYDEVARIGREERTYHQGNSGRGGPFLRDVVRAYTHNDLMAQERLSRHMQEERVENMGKQTRAAGDAGTGAFVGLTVPQYLTDMYAPKTAAMRPFADVANKHDLPPDGMTVNISQITTGSDVNLQASEFTTVTGVSLDDTLLTENIQTAAGFQDLSRQAIDRGTGIEEVTMDDLFRRYASRLDLTMIQQATTGLSAVAQTNTVGSTTFANIYPKFASAQSQAESAFLGFATPNVAVMHPRRWHYFNSQLSGNSWPAIQQPGIPTQAYGINLGEVYGKGVRGILPNGLAVIVDANVPTNLGVGTNEDEIYVVATDEVHLWEDPAAPVFIRAEQPRVKDMAVTLVLYGYFAYSMRRYANGMQKINGAGLVPPTF